MDLRQTLHLTKPAAGWKMNGMSDLVNSYKMDKTAFSVAALGDDSGDREFWLSKTPEERLAAMEFMRVVNYGYDPVTARMERVIEVRPLHPESDERPGG
jgi:hypothetical protein